MDPTMDKAEIRAWMDRWKMVNDFEREELRRTSTHTKALQLAAMMDLAIAMDWQTSTAEELAMIRERWRILKRGFGHGA